MIDQLLHAIQRFIGRERFGRSLPKLMNRLDIGQGTMAVMDC